MRLILSWPVFCCCCCCFSLFLFWGVFSQWDTTQCRLEILLAIRIFFGGRMEWGGGGGESRRQMDPWLQVIVLMRMFTKRTYACMCYVCFPSNLTLIEWKNIQTLYCVFAQALSCHCLISSQDKFLGRKHGLRGRWSSDWHRICFTLLWANDIISLTVKIKV